MIDVEKLVANPPRFGYLSTVDNPWNPHYDFDQWYAWDEAAGYHTSEYLARVCMNADSLESQDEDLAIMIAIEEILDVNVTGKYIKVYEDTKTLRRSDADMF